MALSQAIDNHTGAQVTQPKIIPVRSENCICPEQCQYWNGTECELEECPFKADKTIVPYTPIVDGVRSDMRVSTRKCFICGNTFNGFIGAIPICSTCMERLKYVVGPPHCPGCGREVDTPHTICSSCKQSYLR